jgi:hypothetical protein
MTTLDEAPRAAAPWHLWAVAAVSLLWNAYGGYDYVMSEAVGDAYFKSQGMNPEQIAFIHAYPTWMVADWAIGVWSSVVGSLLLFARSRFALPAFVLSILGILLSLVYAYVLRVTPNDGVNALTLTMQGAITVVCLLLIWYSQAMTKRGVLR